MYQPDRIRKVLIGMVHLGALPGTPRNAMSVSELVEKACSEARCYIDAGMDGIMIENMHDVPYMKAQAGPEIVAAMTAIALELSRMTDKPLGLQILAAANKEALAVALAAGFSFIRAEAYVFGHLADEGYLDSCAGELLRYRKQIGAEHIAIYTDVKKKHSSHALTADVSLVETVKTAEYFLSDGVIITGSSTGEAALIDEVKAARQATTLPLIIGSGINSENIEQYWPHADVFIVGSSIKRDGKWENEPDKERVVQLVQTAERLRQ